jgi:hypothetical protein
MLGHSFLETSEKSDFYSDGMHLHSVAASAGRMHHPELFVLQKTIPGRILYHKWCIYNEEALEENAESGRELFVPLLFRGTNNCPRKGITSPRVACRCDIISRYA